MQRCHDLRDPLTLIRQGAGNLLDVLEYGDDLSQVLLARPPVELRQQPSGRRGEITAA